MYRIEVSPAAERALRKLADKIKPVELDRLRNAIGDLANEPRPDGVRKIVGAERTYRIRIGDYRVIYEIDNKLRLAVLLVVSRRSETTYR